MAIKSQEIEICSGDSHCEGEELLDDALVLTRREGTREPRETCKNQRGISKGKKEEEGGWCGGFIYPHVPIRHSYHFYNFIAIQC